MSAGLGDFDPGDQSPTGRGINKPKRLTMAIQNAPTGVRDQALGKLTVNICDDLAKISRPDWLDPLIEELRSGGLSLYANALEVQENAWSAPVVHHRWKLGPLGAGEIPVPVQASQLEALLTKHNLDVAAAHFAQAYEGFRAGNLEASNGQLRPALEETLLTLTSRATGWTSTGKGGDAISVLDGKKLLAAGEHDYFKGLWKISHANGPHPGLSNQAEAEFRFHAITAAIYYLVHRLA